MKRIQPGTGDGANLFFFAGACGARHPGVEGIFETYYSYALTASTRVSVDYQFIGNPGYNTDRGPANVFAGRVHTQF
jgi:high affinity Mn2+ porin